MFRVVDAINYEKVYQCGESARLDLKTEWPPQGTEPTYSVECISAVCPFYIEFDSEKEELIVDGRHTSSESTEGIYIYRVFTSSITKEPMTL